MVEKTHNATQRSTQRWENEGGAPRGGHVQRARVRSQLKNEDAAKLAGEAIDRLEDPSATSEERGSRKRSLLKGPEEFREMRRDHHK
jgi:hypothetical protein